MVDADPLVGGAHQIVLDAAVVSVAYDSQIGTKWFSGYR
jgi:hypothetical protein